MLTKHCGYSSEKGKRAGPWRDANSGLQRETQTRYKPTQQRARRTFPLNINREVLNHPVWFPRDTGP